MCYNTATKIKKVFITMASWHLNEVVIAGRLKRMSVFWADDRMNGTVRKACPNFPIILPSQAPTDVFAKYLKRCGRKNNLDKSVFITIGDMKYHLFNANERVTEIYTLIWSKSEVITEALSIEDADSNLALYLEVYTDHHLKLVTQYFAENQSERFRARTIINRLKLLDDIFMQEDKIAAQQTKKNNAKKKAELTKSNDSAQPIAAHTPSEAESNTTLDLPTKPAPKQAKQLKPSVIIKPQEVAPVATIEESKPEVAQVEASVSVTTPAEPPQATKAVKVKRKPVTRRRHPTLTHEERETYSPPLQTQKRPVEHVIKNHVTSTPSYIDRLSASKAQNCTLVHSTIKIERVGEHYQIVIPSKHGARRSGAVTQSTVLFRTRSGAKSGIKALDNSKHSKTELTLYLCKRVLDTKITSSGTAILGRNYYKIACSNSEFIDAIMQDWGGTPYGYALHMCKDSNLGKDINSSSQGKAWVKQLLKDGDILSKSHGITPMIAMA